MNKIRINIKDLSENDISEKYNYCQLSLIIKNNVSFYISPKEDLINDTTIFVSLTGIQQTILDKIKGINGNVYIRLKKNNKIIKKKIFDTIDLTRLNLLSDIENNALTIPIQIEQNIISMSYFVSFEYQKKKIPKIAIVGMKHVGSTLLTNILREAYKKLGFKLNDLCEHGEEEVIITKCHHVTSQFIKDDYTLITTIRDVRDVSISGFLRFKYQQSIQDTNSGDLSKEILLFGMNDFLEYMHQNLHLYYDSLEYKPIIFKYEDYKSNPIIAIRKIFEKLDIYTGEEFLLDIISNAESIKDDSNLPENLQKWQQSDRKGNVGLLLTKDHNTSNGRIKKFEKFFTPEQNEIICNDLFINEYLKYNDYL